LSKPKEKEAWELIKLTEDQHPDLFVTDEERYGENPSRDEKLIMTLFDHYMSKRLRCGFCDQTIQPRLLYQAVIPYRVSSADWIPQGKLDFHHLSPRQAFAQCSKCVTYPPTRGGLAVVYLCGEHAWVKFDDLVAAVKWVPRFHGAADAQFVSYTPVNRLKRFHFRVMIPHELHRLLDHGSPFVVG